MHTLTKLLKNKEATDYENNEQWILADRIITDYMKERAEWLYVHCSASKEVIEEALGLKEKTLVEKLREAYPDYAGYVEIAREHFKQHGLEAE